MLGDLVAQVTHNVVSESPETEAETETADCFDPGGCIGFRGSNARDPRFIFSREGSDGVENVVGAVSNRHQHCCADLGCGPEVLDFVLVDDGACVHCF